MKKILRSFVILLMMLLTITGCHKSDDQSHNTSTTRNDTNTNNTSSNTLSQDDVLQNVMKQVSGLEKGNIYIEQEYDDGKSIYEGTAIYDQIEYEFEIEANTGNILEWTSQNTLVNQNSNVDQAINKVIEKIPGIEKENIWLKMEHDDGQTFYEGKAIYNQIEYDFEIEENTGNIVEWEIKN